MCGDTNCKTRCLVFSLGVVYVFKSIYISAFCVCMYIFLYKRYKRYFGWCSTGGSLRNGRGFIFYFISFDSVWIFSHMHVTSVIKR